MPFAVWPAGGALLAAAVMHLVSCVKRMEGLRKYTKALLVPLILCIHIIVCGFSHRLVIAALVCGWIGDILLIPKDRKAAFIAGGAFFLIGHALYIAEAFRLRLPQSSFERAGLVPAVITAAAVAALALAVYAAFYRRMDKRLRIPGAMYALALAFMAGITVWSMIGGGLKAGPLLMAAGGALFAVSDFLLCAGLVRLVRLKNNRFWVMLTYILAQTGLALGFALI
ncbi:MAG: lysoplasmalogenase [Clostridiales bacterium]|nr:lysoplasmalogenase [Clostridiales bacterium]